MILILWLSLISVFAGANELQEGEYLVRAAGCTDCHTANPDLPFAGGIRLPSPFGDFFTPNITPDPETGIGKWTEAQFSSALHTGIGPDGSRLYPAFPYPSFTKITDGDLHKIFVYLMSLKPVHKRSLHNALSFPFNQRWTLRFWQFLFFDEGPYVPDPGRSATWNRGAYLVEALFHCAECHTPRGPLGNLESQRWLAGGSYPLSGRLPPNITPDPETGKSWNTEQWEHFLRSGFDPDGNSPGNEMALVIRGTAGLTQEDRSTLIEYLMSVKPVHTPGEGEQ